MKTMFIAILIATAVLADGADEPLPEIKAEKFRFVRIEQVPDSPIRDDNGRFVSPGTKTEFAVFAFRYRGSKALQFWGFGEPKSRKFTPRFTEYRVHKKSVWEPVSLGYCGTGAWTYPLKPNVDYELLIFIEPSVARAKQIRVSANTPNGTFWSEPFFSPK